MTNSSAQLRSWDAEHVWHPFAPMQSFLADNVPIIADAEGFDLIDVEGRRYLDGISSLWCNVHGHRVPAIDEAVRQQLDRVAHTTLLGLSSVPSIELARALVQLAPAGLNKVFYSDSGATSVEVALKIAFQYHRQKPSPESQRDLFLTIGGAYHGDTIGTVSVGGIDTFHAIYGRLLFSTVRLPSPVALRVPADMSREDYLAQCFADAERIVREHGDRAAALILEPIVQGAAGILVHPPGYLRHIRELTTRHGIPLIADEVAVGFGRTGTMFACEQEQVSPDIMCVAKGLTGGYLPLAATLATDDIYSAFLGAPHQGRTFFHGHTFTGNPLGCAAALASLKLFRENHVLDNARQLEAILRDKLAPLRDHPHVAEVRQRGVMVGIELVQNRATLEPFPSPLGVGAEVTRAARKRGAILRPLGDVIVLMPAPAMPPTLVTQLCDTAIASIEETVRKVLA